MVSSKLENRNIRRKSNVCAWRKSGENAERVMERERERKRIWINCTVPPNCPERINTGIYTRRGRIRHREYPSDNQFPHRDLSVGGFTTAYHLVYQDLCERRTRRGRGLIQRGVRRAFSRGK